MKLQPVPSLPLPSRSLARSLACSLGGAEPGRLIGAEKWWQHDGERREAKKSRGERPIETRWAGIPHWWLKITFPATEKLLAVPFHSWKCHGRLGSNDAAMVSRQLHSLQIDPKALDAPRGCPAQSAKQSRPGWFRLISQCRLLPRWVAGEPNKGWVQLEPIRGWR